MEMSLFFFTLFQNLFKTERNGNVFEKKREDKRFTVLLVVVTCHF